MHLEQPKDLFLKIDKDNIPNHIAIIMDGNRRWAKEQGFRSFYGHKKGAQTLTEIVKEAVNLKIKVLTVFAFSTENWSRAQDEIENLIKLFSLYLKKQLKFLKKEGVRLNTIGDLSRYPLSLQKLFSDTKQKTQEGHNLDLVLAVNYGARDEIKRAFYNMLKDYDEKKIDKTDLSEELINKYLDTKDYKDPELLIRTSGEQRLSNFLLWQISYSEIYITQTLWPNFTKQEFLKAILEYQKRKRKLRGK